MATKPLDALTQLETLVERWLEGSFARLFRIRLHQAELTEQLIRALEDGRTVGPSGVWLAPDAYQVFLHPDDYAQLVGGQNQAEIEKKLTNHLIETAQQNGVTLTRRPQVRLCPSESVPPRQVQVEAHLTLPPPTADETSETREIDIHPLQEMTETSPSDTPLYSLAAPPAPPETDARTQICHLLVSERCFPLTVSPVNLGRGLDNDVVIEHPRVSRYHAQLRQREGQWWLIDLGSANGTAVNDQTVSEAILHPGDVISLANVEIRFEM